MKKLLALTACTAFLLSAVTYTPASACDKDKSASACSAKTGTTASLVSADGSTCKLAMGSYGVVAMKVSGMHCGSCEAKLTNQLSAVKGLVMVASVSSADGTAKVIYDKTACKEDDFVAAVSASGFKGEIVPAVVYTPAGSTDSKGATCTAAQKAACEASKSASLTGAKSNGQCTAEQKAACEASKNSASLTGAKSNGAACCAAGKGASLTSANATMNKADMEACLKACPALGSLTESELAAFCAKFCTTNSKTETKTTTKSSM